MHGHIPMINYIFSERDEVEAVEHLSGDDAQTFIDLVYEVNLYTLSSLTLTETSAPHRLAYR